jgi:hypothetical protein
LDFLHKILQTGTIAKRKNNIEEQGLAWREFPDQLRLPIDNRIADMTRQQGLGLGLSWDCDQHERGRADKRNQSG